MNIEDKKIINENVTRIIKGLSGIGSMDILDFTLNFGITRNLSVLSCIEKAYDKSKDALLKKYAAKDETGGYSMTNGYINFDSDQKRQAYEKEKIALDETAFEDQVYRIKTSQLKDIQGKGLALFMALCHEIIIDDAKVMDF